MAEYFETVPCFLMAGDKLVEAFYLDWESDDGETWTAVDKGAKVPIHERGEGLDRLIVEMPNGCVMTRIRPVNVYPGDTFALSMKSSGNAWEPCERPHMAENAREEMADELQDRL